MTDDRLLAAKKKFSRLLKEIFQFDCADLDFGIYRILAMRRTELEKFLDDDLLPQVEGILVSAAGDRASVQSELAKLEDQLRGMGVADFSTVPKWNELKGKLASSPDVAVLAREVFSDLTTFFARYYDEGDFMALPRYKGDTYAVPYDGSEVKLHWANADQYYIKTTEQHADYTAVVHGVSGLENPRLRFRLAAAESDRDNNQSSEKRRYVMRATAPVELADDELTVWFEYRVPEPGNGRQPTQSAVCEEAEKVILAGIPTAWQAALMRNAPQNTDRTVLGYQLYRYTKKNTADYFIHKDLGGFLRRELDFFIKNEVLFLDDLEGRTTSDIDVALQKVKAARSVGGKIISWLAQVEDFQKKLYLKKKFVIGSGLLWCAPTAKELPLDENQRRTAHAAGLALSGVSRHGGGQASLGDGNGGDWPPIYLVEGSESLIWLARLDDVEVATTGLLVHSDNRGALSTFWRTYENRVDAIYIDPPYNTGNDGFAYRDAYRHSSWMTFVQDRMACSVPLLTDSGAIVVSIDDNEAPRLRLLMDQVFGAGNFIAQIAWQKRYTRSNNTNGFTTTVEHLLAYSHSADFEVNLLPRSEEANNRYTNPDNDHRGPWKAIPFTNPLSAKERPNLAYPIKNPNTGRTIHPTGNERAWRRSSQEFARLVAEGRIYWGSDGTSDRPDVKGFLSEVRSGMTPINFWDHEYAGHTDLANGEVKGMFGSKAFDTIKPTRLIERVCEHFMPAQGGILLDFFAGSGTTGHAVLNQRRRGDRSSQYLLVESGAHFRTLLLPRIAKAALASTWEDARPTKLEPLRCLHRIVTLESYDDTLENVTLTRIATGALFSNSALREDYTLRYMLNLEAEGSLLSLERFRKPWDYTIKVRRDGVVQDSPVDLVETFNYLIGLRVKRYDTYGQDGLLFVLGTGPDGRRVIVVWRDCDLWPNDKLEKKCRQAFESFRPSELDLVYVNGDNHLPIIKTGEESWKVNLIEETFHARMFDTSDEE